MIYPVRRFFVEDAPIQDVKFLRNSEHLIAVSLKNKQSWTYVAQVIHQKFKIYCFSLTLLEYGLHETRISFPIVIGRMQANLLHQLLMIHCTPVVHMPSKNEYFMISISVIHFPLDFLSNQNELLSVPTHSILLPGQNVSNHLQASMLSAWQIVSLDYSEWIDSVAYADLDGKIDKTGLIVFVLAIVIGGVPSRSGVVDLNPII